MNRSRILLALALVVMFVAGGLTASAATSDPCNALFTSNTVAKLKVYTECREDRQDAALQRIEAKLNGTASSPSPSASPTAKPTPSPTPTPKPSVSPTASPSPSPSSTPPAGTCAPGREIVKFNGAGSAGLGQYGQGNYDASAELWNVGGYNYAQTMGVCTHDAWYADVKTDNSKGDGAVKAYPSMRRIYHDWSTSDFSKDPLVSSFPRLDVTFGSNDPATCPGCIYNTAFDIWLNGIGNGNANELMIWTHNVGQTPYGSKVGTGLKIAGHTWDLYSGNSNHYLAFVATDTSNIPSGTFDVQDFTDYLIAQNRIIAASRLGQISFGVETVSTNAVSRHWDFTKFSVVDS